MAHLDISEEQYCEIKQLINYVRKESKYEDWDDEKEMEFIRNKTGLNNFEIAMLLDRLLDEEITTIVKLAEGDEECTQRDLQD